MVIAVCAGRDRCFMTFQAVRIAEGCVQFAGLGGSVCEKVHRVERPANFGPHAARHPTIGMAVDTVGGLGGMEGSQVDRRIGG